MVKETEWGMKFINRNLYERPRMLCNAVAESMSKDRAETLERMDNDILAKVVANYFSVNRTMNNEKILRDTVREFDRIFTDQTSISRYELEYMDEMYERHRNIVSFKEDIIHDISQMCVKQAKLSSHDIDKIKSENQYKCIDGAEYEKSGKVYRLPVVVGGNGELYADEQRNRLVGCIEPNFLERHPNIEDMHADLIVGEFPNQFSDHHVSLIIDLMQSEETFTQTMSNDRQREIEDDFDADEFAQAVAALGKSPDNTHDIALSNTRDMIFDGCSM